MGSEDVLGRVCDALVDEHGDEEGRFTHCYTSRGTVLAGV